MNQINWKSSKEEYVTALRIGERAAAQAEKLGIEYDRQWAKMDVLATHLNGCPLDLEKLEKFDDGNFNHDIFGIYRHLDRNTGTLRDCFVPRCAKPEKAREE